MPKERIIADRVQKLRRALAEPRQETLATYLIHARWLYQKLFHPVKKLFAGKQQLTIVPDGILYYLPLEALVSSGEAKTLMRVSPRRWPYLVRGYTISYVPSASILATLRNRPLRPAPTKTLVAYADPNYQGKEPAAVRSAFGTDKPWELKPLPYSREEVERIAPLYAPGEIAVFAGSQATEENVKAEGRLSQYRFIHFSVHGLLNETRPQYSGLALTLPGAPENPQSNARRSLFGGRNPQSVEDGLLQVYEIFNLKLNAELVALSACETGLGKRVKGEGVIGLTRAFLYAGTPTVIVSLWKVLDRSTPELMARFYRHLKNGTGNKAQALRQAQLELIREGQLAHPYHWALFVLVGRP